MKNIIIILLAAISLLFAGCATTDGTGVSPDQTKLLAKVAVSYAVIKVADKHPEKAAKILAISHEVRAIAGGEGFNTVDLLMTFVRAKVDLSKLDPADQMLAGILLDTIATQLKAKVGSGVLTSDKLLIVGEVAGWIEDAARIAAPPAA